jgi:N-acetylmuramoyl-L-alanine amidase
MLKQIIWGDEVMRKIDKIIWHCSATKEGVAVTVDTIRGWHVKDRGWSDIGYHHVITLDGEVHAGRPLIRAGAHVSGLNATTIGICYVGGLDKAGKPKDTRTAAQKAALYDLTAALLKRFPGATVHGHNEFAAKACPCFDARKDWSDHVLTMGITREDFEEDEDARV